MQAYHNTQEGYISRPLLHEFVCSELNGAHPHMPKDTTKLSNLWKL